MKGVLISASLIFHAGTVYSVHTYQTYRLNGWQSCATDQHQLTSTPYGVPIKISTATPPYILGNLIPGKSISKWVPATLVTNVAAGGSRPLFYIRVISCFFFLFTFKITLVFAYLIALRMSISIRRVLPYSNIDASFPMVVQ